MSPVIPRNFRPPLLFSMLNDSNEPSAQSKPGPEPPVFTPTYKEEPVWSRSGGPRPPQPLELKVCTLVVSAGVRAPSDATVEGVDIGHICAGAEEERAADRHA